VIVEAKIDFDFEITLLTVRALDVHQVIQTYFCAPIGHRQEHGDYRESWQPQIMSAASLALSQDIAFKVTQEIGGLGLFGVELFIQGDNVWFSEVSPRPHDTGMVTMVTQKQNEFELHARAILGLPVNTDLQQAGASAVILGGVDAMGVSYEGLAQALTVPDSEIRLFGKPEAFTHRRMGVALASADSVDEAKNNAIKAASYVVVKV
jgi:phosphoribosylglycinamide formyltransferase 2